MDTEQTNATIDIEKPRSIEGRIVGIGASAGGLESLERLFSVIPRDTGMSFIVVQHLSPDFRSVMDELIARRSDMPVLLVENGMAVEPNRIYLMPPRKEMMIRERRLWLTDKEPHTFSLPIDAFFRSLAHDVGPNAIAIVLSGSGSDGSRGIVDVKRAGGLVLAETPASAKFDGMPMAAAESGVVDHAYPPADLARLLCGLAPSEAAPTEPASLSDDPAMDAVLRLLRDNFGIDFSVYKMTTVGRRIQRRVELLRLAGLAEYVDQLYSDPEELHRLYQDLLIGVTQFFRDPGAFEALERDVIPQMLDQIGRDQEVRLWVAGCATGEEAYSIAMLFSEAFKKRDQLCRVKILATDVHQRSLDHASAGIYGEEQLAHVSPDRLERFFTKRSSGYQVSQELRQLIVFARHNVLKDAPFTKVHFISCRNMMIYLQPAAQRTVLSLFHFGLASNGTLFLGASETPGALSDEFHVVDERWKIFRKRRDVHLLGHVRLPIVRTSNPVAAVELPRAKGADPMLLAVYDQLLDKYMPPGLLLDEDRMLVDAFGGAEKLLRLRRRRPTLSAIDMLGDELRTVVAGAVQRVLKEGRAVSYEGVPGFGEQGDARCVVSAEPFAHPRTGARNLLVTFHEMDKGAAQQRVDGTSLPLSDVSLEHLKTLETELQYTRETLQATIEELETSNEEMQATNEELVASNEELQSTNEELHSVNEELYTVNAEYQQKIGELKELNADMTHLLEGTDVGTVFLDRDLRIRRFTSRIASVFRFQQEDIGRRISDFSHNIQRPQLMDEIEDSRRRGALIEDEVRDGAGTPYFLRIIPYRVSQRLNAPTVAESPPIDGVVLTLTDMTTLDKARMKVQQLSALVEWSDDAIMSLTLDGTITTWNRGAERLFGYPADDAIGRSASMLMRPGTATDLDAYLYKIKSGERIEHAASICRRSDGTIMEVSATISPFFNGDKLSGVAITARDISKLTRTQRALEDEQQKVKALLAAAEQQAHRRDEFLAMLSHELRNPLAAVLSATTALREDIDGKRRQRYQAVIERQAAHMKRLLDDLLDVSRITNDKFDISREDLDLREALDTAMEATAHIYAATDVELDAAIPERPLPMKGDVRRLTQVIVNLLANAATYSPGGTKVNLEVATKQDAIVVRVRDRGEGIPPELQPKIFDLFVQSEQKLDRSRGGLGVGLSLAKTIVQLHDGSIEVHSDGEGQGTEFVVVLPLARSPAATLSQGVPGGPCKIVLVDDQDDARELLRFLFESRNHVVYEAADGAGAVSLISQQKPDVAFIDIGLPVMNGFEVAQQVRRRAELKDVMLVALSGYGNGSDVDAALAAGFDAHVTKPAEFKQLEEILARKRPHTDDE